MDSICTTFIAVDAAVFYAVLFRGHIVFVISAIKSTKAPKFHLLSEVYEPQSLREVRGRAI